MHVDPLSVLDMLDVTVTDTFSPLPSPYMSPPPFFLAHYPTPYVSLTNHSSYPTCCGCCSLQGNGSTALTLASEKGHTEIIQALLAVAGIDVNHAEKVSIYPLTQSLVVVRGGLPHLIPLLNSRNADLTPPTPKIYPISRGDFFKIYC